MDAGLWVTLIIGVATPLCTLLGVIIANNKSNKKQSNAISSQLSSFNDLIAYRIEQLEKKQDIHNGVVERVYVGEGSIAELQHDVKNLNRKIEAIENRINSLHTN